MPSDPADEVRAFYGHEFWRFVFVQQQVAELGQTAVEFPPMQESASFNLSRVKGGDRRSDQKGAGRRDDEDQALRPRCQLDLAARRSFLGRRPKRRHLV